MELPLTVISEMPLEYQRRLMKDLGRPPPLIDLRLISPQQQYQLLWEIFQTGKPHVLLAPSLIATRKYDLLRQLLDGFDGDDIDEIVIRATEHNDVPTIDYMLRSGLSFMYPDLFLTAARTGATDAYQYYMQNYPDDYLQLISI